MGKTRRALAAHWQYIGLSVLALATAGVVASVALTPAPAPQTSEKVSSYYDENRTAKPTATAAPLEKVPVGPGTVSVIFGDSWTAGYASKPSDRGYAYLTGEALGWQNTVMGVSGTGFLNPGPKNEGTYSARFAAMPVREDVQLLVIQGGINDAGQKLEGLHQAVTDALSVAREKFPNANIVILGPATPTIPASPQLTAVHSMLSTVAAEEKLSYISPISEAWINAGNYAEVIDKEALNHPSTAGHAFLAEKTVAALRTLGR